MTTSRREIREVALRLRGEADRLLAESVELDPHEQGIAAMALLGLHGTIGLLELIPLAAPR